MPQEFKKMLHGYHEFREKYAQGDHSIMKSLSYGQAPNTMVIACCDSRVDPALILQCDPGDLFVVRNVANIVPPFIRDDAHHGTSAALEFGICILKVKNLILLGHSQCGGIEALLNNRATGQNDFIHSWVSIIREPANLHFTPNEYAKRALHQSKQNCLTFPWLKEKVDHGELNLHLWFFDIKEGQIYRYSESKKIYQPLDAPE